MLQTRPRGLLIALLFVAVAGLGAPLGPNPARAFEPRAVTLPVNANIRAAPSLNAERLTVIERGRQVFLLGEPDANGWVRVSDARREIEGYLAAHLLEQPANKATPGRSRFAEALGTPATAPGGTASRFADATGGGSAGGGDAGTASPFARTSRSGDFEAAHAENRRRAEEEARRRAEEQERQRIEARRLEEERRQREWEAAERHRIEEQERYEREEWEREIASAEAEAERLQRWNMIKSIERGFQQQVEQQRIALAELQRAQADQRRRLEQDRQRQADDRAHAEQQRRQQEEARRARELERQRQEQARVLTQLRQATQPRPAAPSPTPPPAPRAGTTSPVPSSGGGCWYTPDPPHTSCVESRSRWSGESFVSIHSNLCGNRIYVRMCNQRGAGREPFCGSSGIMPGASKNWSTERDATGSFTVQWVGSKVSTEDFLCVSRVGWRN